MRRLAVGFPGSSAAYVENLSTGAASARNARATFPAASTLKLAIAVTVLARMQGPPPPGARSTGCSGSCSTSPTTRLPTAS